MRNPNRQTTFRFKQFEVSNCRSAMKVGTDGVLLGAWAFQSLIPHNTTQPLRILDVGCGTGVISLMMAQRFPDASIVGIDIDPAAAMEASANFSESHGENAYVPYVPISLNGHATGLNSST